MTLTTSPRRVLVTGASGFLGLWVMRRLLRQGVQVRALDLHTQPEHLAAIVGEAAPQIAWVQGDIRDGEAVRQAMQGCDGVIHLAGLLTSACQQDRVRGAEVNLIGSLHVFDAALAHGVPRVVYASSAGVFGPDDASEPRPATHYGAFKLAVEGSARAYWNDFGLASIGLRPFVIYGPGRESGISAGPSLACRAAARGEAYTLGYTGASGLVYVDDVAQAFVQSLTVPLAGAETGNLVGELADINAVMAHIRARVPGAQLQAEGPPLTITPGLNEDGLGRLLPQRQRTGLAEGLDATLDYYRAQTVATAA